MGLLRALARRAALTTFWRRRATPSARPCPWDFNRGTLIGIGLVGFLGPVVVIVLLPVPCGLVEVRTPPSQHLPQLCLAHLKVLVWREVEGANAGVRHGQRLDGEVRRTGQREGVFRPVETDELREAANGHAGATRHKLEQLWQEGPILVRLRPAPDGAEEPHDQVRGTRQAVRECGVPFPIVHANAAEAADELRYLHWAKQPAKLTEHILRQNTPKAFRHCFHLQLDRAVNTPLRKLLNVLALVVVCHLPLSSCAV
mmetsp:Transcript_73684/g.213473  ORF Transcript_73684/g.213473 Transcript_73684/m.213473 type:complete len:257 (-) Transcript_73684:4209-4979(-)